MLEGTIAASAMKAVASSVISIGAKYHGYELGKRKEDDLTVRKKMMDEITKSRGHLMNIIEEAHGKGDSDTTNAAKKTIDELDLLQNDINLSETGHKYSFFSQQTSINIKTLNQLIEYDKKMITHLENVTETSKKLALAIVDEEQTDSAWELKRIRQYVSTCRDDYKNRRDIIRRL
ncbi:MAG: hypothetical protein JSW28_06445 [Thermoplasmata archaeon]|nr:MAG: hypothetical protein JSW28_06445 [Thermoplasmata archaeon]